MSKIAVMSNCVDDISDDFGKKPTANARKTFEPVCPKMCDQEKPRSRLNELIERERDINEHSL